MAPTTAVAVGEVTDPQRKLDQGYWAMTLIAAIGIVGTVWIMLDGNYWFAFAGLTGLLTSVAFVYITQFYTAGNWRPVQPSYERGRGTSIMKSVMDDAEVMHDHRGTHVTLARRLTRTS